MRNLWASLLLAVLGLVGCATPSPQAQKLKIVATLDEVDGCTEKGTVSTAMMFSAQDAKNQLLNKAAAMGGDTVRVENLNQFWGSGQATVYDCATPERSAKDASAKLADEQLRSAADRVISCQGGPDCEYKWSRAMQWIQANSEWKFRTVTENLMTTEGPMETTKPAYEVTRIATGDGKNYRITMRAWCGAGNCVRRILQLRSDFVDFVSAPPTAR
jgi:hypothetical protein